MTKLLLALPIIIGTIGGMFVSTFAQPEISKKDTAKVSDKWVITLVTNMKGVLGRLDINFPADVERNILI